MNKKQLWKALQEPAGLDKNCDTCANNPCEHAGTCFAPAWFRIDKDHPTWYEWNGKDIE